MLIPRTVVGETPTRKLPLVWHFLGFSGFVLENTSSDLKAKCVMEYCVVAITVKTVDLENMCSWYSVQGGLVRLLWLQKEWKGWQKKGARMKHTSEHAHEEGLAQTETKDSVQTGGPCILHQKVIAGR